MQAIRRLYIYAVTLVALEVMVWGAITLLRTMVGDRIGGTTTQLAGALAFTLVSIPVFLLHWVLAQRGSQASSDENYSGIRAVFLYTVQLATLVPVAQNILALVNRVILTIFNEPVSRAVLGGEQTWGENLVAILINLSVAWYFYRVLQADWAGEPKGTRFLLARRLYRYIWMVYGLAFIVWGVYQLISAIITTFGGVVTIGNTGASQIAQGISFALVGVGVFLLVWRVIVSAAQNQDERWSQMRIIIFYAITLAALGSILIPVANVITFMLDEIFSGSFERIKWLNAVKGSISFGLVALAVWVYFGGILEKDVDSLPDQQKKAAYRRFYRYILAFFGLIAWVAGIELLVSYALNSLFGSRLLYMATTIQQLSTALASLIVGLPLWLRSWQIASHEAALLDEAGDHARRSVMRKAYLYLVLFVCVVVVMITAGRIFYMLLLAVLGSPEENPLLNLLQVLKTLVVFALLLVYHFRALRADGRVASDQLVARHRQSPVLMLCAAGEEGFFNELVEQLRTAMPGLPVHLHDFNQDLPPEIAANTSAVVLSADLAITYDHPLRDWLDQYTGQKIIVPLPSEGWIWLGVQGRGRDELAEAVVQITQQMIEGQPLHLRDRLPAWLIVLAVIGALILGLIVLSIGINLISLM